MMRLLVGALLLMSVGSGCEYQHGPVWDQPPRALSQPEPNFSIKLQSAQARLFLDDQGNVVEANVVGEPRGYRGELLGHAADQEIVALMKQYKFKPAQVGGRPISAEVFVEINIDPF